IVNGHPEVRNYKGPVVREEPAAPAVPRSAAPSRRRVLAEGTRDVLRRLGADSFAAWVLGQERLLLSDTPFRDGHQAPLATRMPTQDMLRVAPFYAARLADLFSLEMWGGATFDVSMRFLKESPWDRLADLRERVPNLLFQMLLRSASAVGYTNYPD